MTDITFGMRTWWCVIAAAAVVDAGGGVEVHLLGPMEVTTEYGHLVTLRGLRPRATLAMLALNANQPVTTQQLIHGLWGADSPKAARQSIHFFIHQLRRMVGQELIQTQDATYRLRLAPEQTDVVQFGLLVDRARAARDRGALQDAWEVFGQALGLWRGVALSEFVSEPFAVAERDRMEDRRLAAVEEQLRVGMALGQHTELIGELEALTGEQPLRQGLWVLWMLALYRAGRQAEALAAYQTARAALVERGLGPGDELQRLERAVLSQDPTLAPPPRQPVPRSAFPPPAPTTPNQRLEPPVVAPVPVRGWVREERKTVTVLAVGVGGMAGDPEDVRAHVAEISTQVGELVGRYGGIVQPEAMGRQLVVFGAQKNHEDDPERAVRAALELRADVPTASGPVRIGVATGEAVVTRAEQPPGAEDENLVAVVGNVLDMAAMLETSAPLGSVIVGSRTYWATGRMIAYRPASSEPDSLGEVRSWEALAPRARTGATLGGVSTPLIERDRQLTVLTDILARSLRDQEPQLLTVMSEPGLGKTRLVAELGRLVDQAPKLVTWRSGRSVAYGTGSLGALAEIIKAHTGVLDTDPPDQALDKLGQAVAHTISDPDESAWVSEQLRTLIGPTSTQANATSHAHERVAGWIRFLAAAAAQRPMVLVFEDLHWADDLLLEFIEVLVDQAGSVPLLVVCTARPEFLDRRPRWGGGMRNTATVSLSALSPQGTEQLLDALVGADHLAPDTRVALVRASGGNPLYVEEYVRMLTDGQSGTAALAGAAAAVPAPETIQQLIAARLDTVPRGDKLLVQDASVIGETGWVGALAAVSGRNAAEVEEAVRRLERRGLLRRVRAPAIAGESEFAFRHSLIREVAYQQLMRAERADKHQRVAGWLHDLNADACDRVDLLAYHYGQALELTRTLDQPGDELVRRTREASRSAGDRATGLSAVTSAVQHYQRALELWPADDPSLPELQVRLGEALLLARHDSEALSRAGATARSVGREDLAIEAELLLRNLARGPGEAHQPGERPGEDIHDGLNHRAHRPLEEQTNHPDGQVAVAAMGSRATELLVASCHSEALTVAQNLIERASTLGLAEYEGLGLALAGDAQIRSGDPTGKASFAEGMRRMEARRFPMRIWACFGHARSLWILGDLHACAGALQEGRDTIGTAATATAWCDALNAGLDYAAGRWDPALAAAERTLASTHAQQERFPVAWSLMLRGRIRLGRNDLDGALADAGAALDLAGEVRNRHEARALVGRALLATKHRDQAAACAAQLIAEHNEHPEQAAVTPDLVRLLVDLGDASVDVLPEQLPPTRWHRAAQAFLAGRYRDAAELYDTIGSRVDAAHARMRWAHDLNVAGRHGEATEILDVVCAVFQQAGATAELDTAVAVPHGGTGLG